MLNKNYLLPKSFNRLIWKSTDCSRLRSITAIDSFAYSISKQLGNALSPRVLASFCLWPNRTVSSLQASAKVCQPRKFFYLLVSGVSPLLRWDFRASRWIKVNLIEVTKIGLTIRARQTKSAWRLDVEIDANQFAVIILMLVWRLQRLCCNPSQLAQRQH